MGSLRRQVGFWSAVGSLRIRDLLTFEIAGGALVGTAASLVLIRGTSPDFRHALAGDYLSLTPALLGVVFAALALVVALMTDGYLKVLRETDGGVLAFLRPFTVVIGLQVGALLTAVMYRAFADLLTVPQEQWAFGVATVLFGVSTLEVVALARNVVMHGLARGRLEEVTDLTTQREARQRRSGA